jgi:hypothetical protein
MIKTLTKSFFLFLLTSLFFACNSYINDDMLDQLIQREAASSKAKKVHLDDIHYTYTIIKEELTEKMAREEFLIHRVVREKERFIRFSNQYKKLHTNIADQEARGVEPGLIETNRKIGKYIQKIVVKTQIYIKKLEIELAELTRDSNMLRAHFDKIDAAREAASKTYQVQRAQENS